MLLLFSFNFFLEHLNNILESPLLLLSLVCKIVRNLCDLTVLVSHSLVDQISAFLAFSEGHLLHDRLVLFNINETLLHP